MAHPIEQVREAQLWKEHGLVDSDESSLKQCPIYDGIFVVSQSGPEVSDVRFRGFPRRVRHHWGTIILEEIDRDGGSYGFIEQSEFHEAEEYNSGV